MESKMEKALREEREFARLAEDFKRIKAERAKAKGRGSGEQIGLAGLKGKSSLKPKQSIRQFIKAQGFKKAPKLSKADEALNQLRFALSDFKDTDKAVRRSIERRIKKNGKGNIFWIPAKELKAIIFELRNNKTPLSKRSEKVWVWLKGLRQNGFQSGAVAINLNEIKAFCNGHNRYQCAELFIAYFSVCAHAQGKAKFVFDNYQSCISHFGFNNSYCRMSWRAKQFALMNKIIKRMHALGSVYLFALKKKTHKSGKAFYELWFKSLNKFSKALSEKERLLAVAKIKKVFGRLRPPPIRLLGLNLELSK